MLSNGLSCKPTDPCPPPQSELNGSSQSHSRTISPSSSAPKTQSSRSLSFEHEPGATSSYSSSKQIPSCPSSTCNEDCQRPANPTVPIIKVTTPADSSLIDLHTETSSRGNTGSPINRQTTDERAGLLRPPPQHCSTMPSPTQQRATSPQQARKALRVVIRFCEHQRSGFLELEEGVLLGKLDERLRRSCE